MQDWFRKNFRYSTSVSSGNDATYLEQFLRDKTGYCEQFAATMALMARAVGIPARVAVGFTQGTSTGNGGWAVTLREAHAWPELWIGGGGWMRFEPTPRADAGVAVPIYAAPATAPRGPSASPTTSSKPGDPSAAVTKRLGDRDTASPAAEQEAPANPWVRLAVWGGLLLVLLVASVPALIRVRRRRRRLADTDATARAEGAWAELRDTVRDVRLPWSDADSPRQRGRALAAATMLDPAAGAALDRLVQAAETSRYARPGAAVADPAADLAAVRAALLSQADRGTRWRARWWPPTVVSRNRPVTTLRDEGSTVSPVARETVGAGRR
jgi:hypothetical protein